jgi:hypothetical protein
VTRPRAADDFAMIRARMEELRRERTQHSKREGRDAEDAVAGGRGLLKTSEARQRLEPDHWPVGSSGRRYGSGR